MHVNVDTKLTALLKQVYVLHSYSGGLELSQQRLTLKLTIYLTGEQGVFRVAIIN